MLIESWQFISNFHIKDKADVSSVMDLHFVKWDKVKILLNYQLLWNFQMSSFVSELS